MPASPPPADDSEELDEDDVFADDVFPALEPVELLVLVATTAVAAATAAAAVGSRRFGLILFDIGLACLLYLPDGSASTSNASAKATAAIATTRRIQSIEVF